MICGFVHQLPTVISHLHMKMHRRVVNAFVKREASSCRRNTFLVPPLITART